MVLRELPTVFSCIYTSFLESTEIYQDIIQKSLLKRAVRKWKWPFGLDLLF